jgi:hypothetical protein
MTPEIEIMPDTLLTHERPTGATTENVFHFKLQLAELE